MQHNKAHSHVTGQLRRWEGERCGRQHQPLKLLLRRLQPWLREEAWPVQRLRLQLLTAMLRLPVLTHRRGLCLRELTQHLLL